MDAHPALDHASPFIALSKLTHPHRSSSIEADFNYQCSTLQDTWAAYFSRLERLRERLSPSNFLQQLPFHPQENTRVLPLFEAAVGASMSILRQDSEFTRKTQQTSLKGTTQDSPTKKNFASRFSRRHCGHSFATWRGLVTHIQFGHCDFLTSTFLAAAVWRL